MTYLKRTALISTLIASTGLITANVQAETNQTLQEVRGVGTVTSSTITGAAVGGPVGAMAGFIAGAFLNEHWMNHDKKVDALEKRTMQVQIMDEELEQQSLEIAQLEKMIQEKMQFQMYFETGQDQLSEADAEQLKALADFLAENEYMHVSIDGHTDPRGSDDFNQVLSEERAHSVANVLAEQGIDANRVSTRGYGASFSKGFSDDAEDYARERKVKVEISPSRNSADLASIK